jgi:hypothetical protein
MSHRGEARRALCDFILRSGASIEFRPTGSGHFKALITLAGQSRFIIMAATPRTSNTRQVLGDARRTLRELSTTGANYERAV